MAAEIDIACFRGDTASWTITASVDGVPLDLTTARLVMAARRNYASPMLFERTSDAAGGIVIDPDQTANKGKAVITLKSPDTLQLPNDEVDLVYTIHVIIGTNEWAIVRGTLTVSPIGWDGVS